MRWFGHAIQNVPGNIDEHLEKTGPKLAKTGQNETNQWPTL